MMLAVVSNPTDDIAFDGALAENREHIAHPTVSLKGPVREKPVIPDGDSYTSQDIAHEQDHQLARSHHPVPKQHDRDYKTHQRQHGPSKIGQLAGPAHTCAYPMPIQSLGRAFDNHRAHGTGYRASEPLNRASCASASMTISRTRRSRGKIAASSAAAPHLRPACTARRVSLRDCLMRLGLESYLVAITIESGPVKCSARVVVKPASFIQP